MKFNLICVKAQTMETELNQTAKCWFGLADLDLPPQTAWFCIGSKMHLQFGLFKMR